MTCVHRLIAVSLLFIVAGCGGSGISKPNADNLAAQISASSCDDSGYYLTNRLDGSKAEVFSCDVGGVEKCVMEQGGVAQDVTVEFKAFLSTTLGTGDKPTCATG